MIQKISPQSGHAFVLRKSQTLKVIDPEGGQVSDLFCVSLQDHNEWFSASRTLDYAESIYIGEGALLYSNRSTPMMRIRQDTCGVHDLLMPPCSLKMFQIVAGNSEYHPSCDQNLVENLARFNILPDRVATAFNVFMNVKVSPAGKLAILRPVSKSGDFVVIEALMDLIVALTACSHEESNGGSCKPIHFEVS